MHEIPEPVWFNIAELRSNDNPEFMIGYGEYQLEDRDRSFNDSIVLRPEVFLPKSNQRSLYNWNSSPFVGTYSSHLVNESSLTVDACGIY